MIPITEAQAQGVIDALFTFLEAREGPVARIATLALQASLDSAILPAFWAYLKARGIVA